MVTCGSIWRHPWSSGRAPWLKTTQPLTAWVQVPIGANISYGEVFQLTCSASVVLSINVNIPIFLHVWSSTTSKSWKSPVTLKVSVQLKTQKTIKHLVLNVIHITLIAMKVTAQLFTLFDWCILINSKQGVVDEMHAYLCNTTLLARALIYSIEDFVNCQMQTS